MEEKVQALKQFLEQYITTGEKLAQLVKQKEYLQNELQAMEELQKELENEQ